MDKSAFDQWSSVLKVEKEIIACNRKCLKNVNEKQAKELSVNIKKLEKWVDGFEKKVRDFNEKTFKLTRHERNKLALALFMSQEKYEQGVQSKLNRIEQYRADVENFKAKLHELENNKHRKTQASHAENNREVGNVWQRVAEIAETYQITERKKGHQAKKRTGAENIQNENPFMEFFKLLEKNETSDLLDLDLITKDGRDYSLLSLYLSEVVAAILKNKWDGNQAFVNSSFREAFLRKRWNEMCKTDGLYLEMKEFFEKYHLMGVSYAQHNNSKLKIGLFIAFLDNNGRAIEDGKAVIVALSNNANAFEVKLIKNEQDLQTQTTPLAIAFFEILSVWMGNIDSISLPLSKEQGIQTSFNQFSLDYIDKINKKFYGGKELLSTKKLEFKVLNTSLKELCLNSRFADFYSSGIHPLFVNFFLQYFPDRRFPITTRFSLEQNKKVKKPLFTSSLPLIRTEDGFKDPVNGESVEKDQVISDLSWKLQNKIFDGIERKPQEYYRLGECIINQKHVKYETEVQPSGILMQNCETFVINDLKESTTRHETISRQMKELREKLKNPQKCEEGEFRERLISLAQEVVGSYSIGLSGDEGLFTLMARIAKYAYPSWSNRGDWILLMLCAYLDPKNGRRIDLIHQSFFAPYRNGSSESRQFSDVHLTRVNSKGNVSHEIEIEIGEYVKPIHFLLTALPTKDTSRDGWPTLKGIINLIEFQEAERGGLNYSNIAYYDNSGEKIRVKSYEDDLFKGVLTRAQDKKQAYQQFLRKKVPILKCMPIKDFDVDKSCLAQCVKVYNEIEDRQGAVLIHCRAGVGRTGMAAMSIILDRFCANYREVYKQKGIQLDQESFLSGVYSYLFLLRMTRSCFIIQSNKQAEKFFEFVDEKWRELEEFYSKEPTQCTSKEPTQGASDSPLLLEIPSHYSAYPCSILDEKSVYFQDSFKSFRNVISFVPNYLFVAQRSRHNGQGGYLPFYLPVFPKAFKKTHFIDQNNFFQFVQQYFLFAFSDLVFTHDEVPSNKTLASIYHPFLLMLNKDSKAFSHLYDRIFFVMTELLMDMLYAGLDSFCRCNLRCCNKEALKKGLMKGRVKEVMQYYRNHFYDLFHVVSNLKVNVRPLHLEVAGFPSWFNKDLYEQWLSKIHHEDQRRQFATFYKDEILHSRWRKGGTSQEQIKAEREYLETRIAKK